MRGFLAINEVTLLILMLVIIAIAVVLYADFNLFEILQYILGLAGR